jgi:hypothetical protein
LREVNFSNFYTTHPKKHERLHKLLIKTLAKNVHTRKVVVKWEKRREMMSS